MIWMEAKFQKIGEIRKEAVTKEGFLQKLEKEESMIDKASM